MHWTIRYHAIAKLPKLAWLASLELGGGDLSIFHGSAVECHDRWMVEGVWDGDFGRGDFHRSENFFGSGIRVDGNRAYFAPSSALVDRLFYCLCKKNMLVSNSLVLLLAFTGAKLDSSHDYMIESKAILKGIKHYKKDFPVLHPDIERFYQLYYENIVVENGRISFELRSSIHDIDSFEQYYSMLNEILIRLKHNYESPIRRIQLDAFITMSSGYDSPAVSCLAKTLGVTTCFTSKRSDSAVPRWVRKNVAIDDGRPIAAALQLETLYLDRRLSSVSGDELYFYAVDPLRAELVFHTMATHIEKTCQAAVVYTGYHGDKVWDANLRSKYVNDQIIRGDISGLRLSEIRLKSGFIRGYLDLSLPGLLRLEIQGFTTLTP
jgi:hypothetical protein